MHAVAVHQLGIVRIVARGLVIGQCVKRVDLDADNLVGGEAHGAQQGGHAAGRAPGGHPVKERSGDLEVVDHLPKPENHGLGVLLFVIPAVDAARDAPNDFAVAFRQEIDDFGVLVKRVFVGEQALFAQEPVA